MTSDTLVSTAQSQPLHNGDTLGVLQSIQALRFIAAFVVVVYHAGIAGRHYGFLDARYDQLLTYSVIGQAGVHVFFVISGFLMVYTTRDHVAGYAGAANFLRHRFERIYPIYWLYAAMYLAFHIFVLGTTSWDFGDVWLALALIPGYSAVIIGPGWTLGYEVYFYLVFGLSLFLPARFSLLAVTGLLFVMMAMGVVFRPSQPFWTVLTNTLLVEFLAGAWLAKLHLSSRLPTRVGSAAIVLASAWFVAALFVLQSNIPTIILWGVPSMLLVFGLVQRESDGKLPALFVHLSKFGNSSYSLYLLHTLVLDIVFTIFAKAAGSMIDPLVILLSIAISCAIGHLAFHALERPLYRTLKSRRTSQSTARA